MLAALLGTFVVWLWAYGRLKTYLGYAGIKA